MDEASIPYTNMDNSSLSYANMDDASLSYANMDDSSLSYDIYLDLEATEKKFKKACDQVVLLNGKLEGLQRRYDKARIDNRRSFRYNLRLRMATVEGVRNAYYQYACDKAERIGDLRFEVAQMEADDNNILMDSQFEVSSEEDELSSR